MMLLVDFNGDVVVLGNKPYLVRVLDFIAGKTIFKNTELFIGENVMKKIAVFSLLVFLVVSFAVFAVSADMIKIAVASDGKTESSAVGSVAARISGFLIFDGNGKFVEAINNPHKEVRGGAGPMVVNFLAQKGVTVITAQSFGKKMVDAMKAKGVAHFEFKGNAGDAVRKYLKQK